MSRANSGENLAREILTHNRRALARLISLIEDDLASARDALAYLFPYTGKAHLIGITGAPGTGKSSLVNQIALVLRKEGRTVAILAIDPTSPFSGGAILGDRIRMRDLAGDAGVFIRSMATRGSLGGLARAASDTIKVMDAAGFDVVLVETVGAGQAEVDIARYAHSVVVVEAPGLGDEVQAAKAGILEIADILVVNKADDPRAENTARSLRAMLELGLSPDNHRAVVQHIMHHGQLLEVISPSDLPNNEGTWQVPIQMTNALTGEGVAELIEALQEHQSYLRASGELARRERVGLLADLDNLLRETLLTRLLAQVDRDRLADLVERVAARELIPQAAVEQLLEGMI